MFPYMASAPRNEGLLTKFFKLCRKATQHNKGKPIDGEGNLYHLCSKEVFGRWWAQRAEFRPSLVAVSRDGTAATWVELERLGHGVRGDF